MPDAALTAFLVAAQLGCARVHLAGAARALHEFTLMPVVLALAAPWTAPVHGVPSPALADKSHPLVRIAALRVLLLGRKSRWRTTSWH